MMRPPATSLPLTVLCSLLGAAGSLVSTAAAVPPPPSVAGLWEARIQNGAVEVPFEFGIAVHGSQVSGWFFNGNEKVVSTSGTLDSTHLTLEFPSYARRLDVRLHDGATLTGIYAPTRNTDGLQE